jgi:geranylgeranyl diphosphate synthase type II
MLYTFQEMSVLIQDELIKLELDKKSPSGLYYPAHYTLELGGKRIRPALVLMACNVFSDDVKAAIKPALGIEIFHNFTLLHDDIMDHADIRRGQPTVHKKWNQNTAILSGDVMQIIAYQLVSETPSTYLKQVLDLFSTTASEVCEGQQLDMEFEKRIEVASEEYLEMIRLKTAVLLACSLKTGALIGGADAENAQLLYDFGINIGLAFQLKDDLLDVYGDETVFGKKIGGDILCNKHTFLLIHAKNRASGENKEKLFHLLNDGQILPQEKITGVTEIYNQLEVKKICEDAMIFYYEKAIACLESIQVEQNKKEELRKLTQKLMLRND